MVGAISLAYPIGEEWDNFLIQNDFYLPLLRVEEGGGVITLWVHWLIHPTLDKICYHWYQKQKKQKNKDCK
jgi:hypothetical protein